MESDCSPTNTAVLQTFAPLSLPEDADEEVGEEGEDEEEEEEQAVGCGGLERHVFA